MEAGAGGAGTRRAGGAWRGASLQVAEAGRASQAPGLPEGHPRPLHPGPDWMGSGTGSMGRSGLGPTFFGGEKKIIPGEPWGEAPQSSLLRVVGSACSGRLGRKQRGSFEATGGCRTLLQGVLGKDQAGAGPGIQVQEGTRPGWAGVEATPAALLRAPREVRLFPGQRCWTGGSRRAARSEEAPRPREAQSLGAREVPVTENGHLPFCKGGFFPRPHHFPRPKGRQGGPG